MDSLKEIKNEIVIKNQENLVVPLKYLGLDQYPIYKGMLGIFQGLITPNYEVLDVGCGNKILTRFIKCKKLVGIDIHEDYLTKFDVHGDIRNLSKLFKEKSFDCLFCTDVIEHLTNTEGIQLMKDMERIARKKVIIFTPTTWNNNEDASKNPAHWSFGNPYQNHKSLWSENDFTSQGYYRMQTVYNNDYIVVIKTLGGD